MQEDSENWIFLKMKENMMQIINTAFFQNVQTRIKAIW